MSVPVPKPPNTHVATLTTNTVEFTLDPKTNRISVKGDEAFLWAFVGSEGAAPQLPASGDGAGVNQEPNALLELTVSAGTDRVAGLSLFIEPLTNPTRLELVAEE